MANFINIRPQAKAPLIINADNISLILHRYIDKGAFTPKPTLAFHDQALGCQLWMDQDSADLDTGTIMAAMKGTGANLLALPLVREDGGEYGMAYINPKSFLAIITSATSTPADSNEPHTNILLDITGYGRLESEHLPVRIVNDFMDSIRAHKPNLMTVLPDVAKSRFIHAGYTTFDPTKVTTIRPNGYDMDIGLQDGFAGGARIDFTMHSDMSPLNDTDDNYADRLWKRAERLKVKGLENPTTRAPILHEIFARATKRAGILRDQSKNDLAAAIGNANPALLKVENSKQLYYVTPAEIALLQCHDTRLSVQMRSLNKEYRDSMTISFETAEMAQGEALRLLTAMNGGPAADINKPAISLKNMQKRLQQNPKAP